MLIETSTEDLIKELLSRHDHIVISGIKILEIGQDGKQLYISRWKGNMATCCGLCARVQYVINEQHFHDSEDVRGEDY